MSIYVYEIHYGRSKQIKKKEGTNSRPSPTKSIYSLSFSLLTNSAVFLLNFMPPVFSIKKTSMAD